MVESGAVVKTKRTCKMKRSEEHNKNATDSTDSLLLHSILDTPQELIFFALDTNYRYTAFTSFHKSIMKNFWGVEIEVGLNMLDLIPYDEHRNKAKNNFDRVLNGEHFIVEDEFRSENLQKTTYHSYHNPIKDLNGNIVGLSVFVIDFTEKYTAQKTLAESEEKYRTLAETAGDIIITYTTKGEITYLNEATLSITNLTRDNYPGTSLMNFIPQKYHEMLAQNLREREAGFLDKRVYEMELIDKDGKLFPVEIASAPILSNGKLTGFISIARNIAERKLAEEKLRMSEKKFRLLIENAPDLVFKVNLEGFLTYISPSSKQFGGYDEIEELGKHFSEYLADKNQLEKFALAFQELIKEQKNQVVELFYLPKERKPFWAEVTATPVVENNEVIEIHCILRNIEERKQAEEKIKAQLSELQKWYTTTMGREERIIEIKKEVNTLLKQMGQPKKYRV